jgi:RNA polymerase sigma-70 factor (ECF subfamily)
LTASPDEDPEVALLAYVGSGDAGATREMVARKLPRLLALATRMLGNAAEAEDVAQESFVRLWRQAPRDSTPGCTASRSTCATTGCGDGAKWRWTVCPTGSIRGRRPMPALEEAGISAAVATALLALPERQREAIVLHYYQELSNSEAAAAMGVSVEALESLLSRARRALRTLLKEDADDQ